MRKTISAMAVLFVITTANLASHAQDKEKKETEKPPQTSTADAWRQALPATEQPQTTTPVSDETNTDEVVETPAAIEKKILELEKRMMEAVKTRDSATLKSLLADDFLLAGINIAGEKSDKTRYINWAVKNLELKTYSLDKSTVRVFPATAIVSYNYKRQANIGGTPADGDFVVTDVWVKRANQWVVVSHHISSIPKP
jgi:ketosteroid isomerase-like protein